MARKPLQEGIPLPGPPPASPEAIRQYLGALAQGLRAAVSEIANAVNDDLLVRSDWVTSASFGSGAFPYTLKGTDRILICVLDGAGANQVVNLPPTAEAEPHFYGIMQASIVSPSKSVVVTPAPGERLNWVVGGTKLVAQGEMALLVRGAVGFWWSPTGLT